MLENTKDWVQFIDTTVIRLKVLNSAQKLDGTLRRSRSNLQTHKSLFPPLPNQYTGFLNPLQVLTLIKYIKPDALEQYIKSFIGESRSKFFTNIYKNNIESIARCNWFRRPTILFFGKGSGNPIQQLEIIAIRNS